MIAPAVAEEKAHEMTAPAKEPIARLVVREIEVQTDEEAVLQPSASEAPAVAESKAESTPPTVIIQGVSDEQVATMMAQRDQEKQALLDQLVERDQEKTRIQQEAALLEEKLQDKLEMLQNMQQNTSKTDQALQVR